MSDSIQDYHCQGVCRRSSSGVERSEACCEAPAAQASKGSMPRYVSRRLRGSYSTQLTVQAQLPPDDGGKRKASHPCVQFHNARRLSLLLLVNRPNFFRLRSKSGPRRTAAFMHKRSYPQVRGSAQEGPDAFAAGGGGRRRQRSSRGAAAFVIRGARNMDGGPGTVAWSQQRSQHGKLRAPELGRSWELVVPATAIAWWGPLARCG
ncbi:hypothetical protein VTK26DRAFT_1470 [Humicola hyalothermophila]